MTTAEFLVCELLACGELDINFMFDRLTDTDFVTKALQDLKDCGAEINANSWWYRAIELAIYQVFGEDKINDFEIFANCLGSYIQFLGKAKKIRGFKSKVAEFEELTGFSIQH